ncbi:uncharacterized protein LOC120417330 [Culex pipiens pallens]|uniref:uncharacterized protein LOC120417330 n=1 Tax=Culex pipiens pallens TaxID=42434 RepID=UPI0019544F81|nr:uncharacterized protein LOC120417330 [Culex pipiens pallens]
MFDAAKNIVASAFFVKIILIFVFFTGLDLLSALKSTRKVAEIIELKEKIGDVPVPVLSTEEDFPGLDQNRSAQEASSFKHGNISSCVAKTLQTACRKICNGTKP